MSKPLRILLIHLLEMLHVIQEDTNSDDLADLGSTGLKDGLDILTALSCFLADGAFDQGAFFVGGELAGDPDLGGGFDGLGVWSSGCRGVWLVKRLCKGETGWFGEGLDG